MIYHNSPVAKVYGRQRDWLTMLQKGNKLNFDLNFITIFIYVDKSKIPSPDKYTVSPNLNKSQNIAMNKSSR